jgi:phosphatidylserine/phosphatidylglycerophosphate/cardiolipin synthase-like enzyme
VLIDGEAYFSRLAQCLSKAHYSIFVIAWDFDGAIRLDPSRSDQTVGRLLRSLVDSRPDLHVRVLVWSEATIHASGATMPLLLGDDWSDHERICVKLDKRHPIYAAHHQKIVSVDDQVSFVGGMDLTVDRWDTPDHATDHPFRLKPDGTPYTPVHDVQMVVDGDAAYALANIARERWEAATGEKVLASPAG